MRRKEFVEYAEIDLSKSNKYAMHLYLQLTLILIIIKLLNCIAIV